MHINNKLKSELLMVIGQMEVQLDRVKEKRKDRMDAEAEAKFLMGDKAKEL